MFLEPEEDDQNIEQVGEDPVQIFLEDVLHWCFKSTSCWIYEERLTIIPWSGARNSQHMWPEALIANLKQLLRFFSNTV